MQNGDYIRTRYLVEVAGVITQQSQDWLVVDVGSDPLATNLIALGTAWWNARRPLMGTNCMISCLIMKNWSRNEQQAVYIQLSGFGGGPEIHPQSQVVRINKYTAKETITGKVLRGATNISGVMEDLSTRGRINDLAEFDAARLFESATYDAGPTGFVLDPQLRWYDDGPVPPVYRFEEIVAATVNPAFLTLRNRKTSSCAA
jgi:hypothetical protein